GFPILKLKGHYLAMATLGFGIIMYIIFNETVELTGGPSGLSGIPNLHIGSLIFDNDLNNYYLVWTFTLAVMLLSINLSQSRIGRALRAIHDSEVAARVMGVNARILKVQIFTVSAVISAVAGSLYAHIMTFIAPASFGFNFSVELLTMVVVGGLGSIYGSFLGAAILTMLPELLRVFQNFDIVIYGLMLILMTMFMPGGLISGIGAIAEFVAARIRKRKDDHAQA
ncbi:MAG: branched-chain amino acid ABC transporter permease, partial [Smithella sp.]